MSDLVLFEASDGVATITINRPEVRNALNYAASVAIQEAMDELDARADVHAGILTGAGGFFCAGMDLKAVAAGERRPIVEGRGTFGLCGRPPSTPLIAAVEGKALGGGFEIALACDLIVAGSDVLFGLPEVMRGLVAAAGGVTRLPRLLPRKLALELVMTGAPLAATRAHELGLVARITEPGGSLDAAQELAATIAANAPLAVATAKRIVYESADWPESEIFARQNPLVQVVRDSDDAKEGAAAFVEKRAPVWTGR